METEALPNINVCEDTYIYIYINPGEVRQAGQEAAETAKYTCTHMDMWRALTLSFLRLTLQDVIGSEVRTPNRM